MQRGTWRAACGAQRVDDALRRAGRFGSRAARRRAARSWTSSARGCRWTVCACSALTDTTPTYPSLPLQRILLRACDPAVRRSTASAPFWERARPAQRRPLADSRARSPRSYRSGDRACLTPSFMRLRAAVPAVPAAVRKALRDPPVQRPRLSSPNGWLCAGAHPCRERPARDDAVRRHALHARVLHAAVVQAHAAHRQDALDTGLQADRLRQPLPLPVLRLRHRPSAPRPV